MVVIGVRNSQIHPVFQSLAVWIRGLSCSCKCEEKTLCPPPSAIKFTQNFRLNSFFSKTELLNSLEIAFTWKGSFLYEKCLFVAKGHGLEATVSKFPGKPSKAPQGTHLCVKELSFRCASSEGFCSSGLVNNKKKGSALPVAQNQIGYGGLEQRPTGRVLLGPEH